MGAAVQIALMSITVQCDATMIQYEANIILGVQFRKYFRFKCKITDEELIKKYYYSLRFSIFETVKNGVEFDCKCDGCGFNPHSN